MTSSKNPHIVIVGAGIIGATIAFNMSLRNANVTVLDAEEPGQQASRVSFAWMNGRDKNPRHYHDINRRSVDMWNRLERLLGGDVGVTWGGEIRWAATQEGAGEMLARVEELQSWAYPIRSLDEAEFREMEPNIEPGTVAAASYTAIDGHVDPPRVIKACLDRATQAGVTLRTNTKAWGVKMAQTPSGQTRVESLDTSAGEIQCDAVVLAAGADTTELAATAGIELQHHWTFGATIVTEATSPLFKTAAAVHTPRDADPMMNFRQLPNGSMMIHGGSHGGSGDESMGRTEEEVREVFEAAKRYLPSLDRVTIKEVRRGRRPMPADGLPILGFAKSVPNLYFATMHSGVSLAPLVGEFATTEVLDGARIDILEPYRVERFVR
ncbi:MAG: FAD-dependent oxidoreductase [Chloroflexi bacterium]|nr:FAD-dependent oxidoreductase [Chloroflexota bacterium]MDA1226797.1 FAD-dependent oxidoreductase [Chloroflexota bacterium]